MGDMGAGTLVTYLLNDKGEPYMLLANNAAHTRNLLNNPKVALYVQNPKSPGQKGARVTLVGEIQKITSATELNDCKEFYADRFPDQAQPLEDERFERFFSMYKILLKDIYYVSGFGVTTCWVAPSEFSKAEADPLAVFAPALLVDWAENRLPVAGPGLLRRRAGRESSGQSAHHLPRPLRLRLPIPFSAQGSGRQEL
jgi:hypothetical protein